MSAMRQSTLLAPAPVVAAFKEVRINANDPKEQRQAAQRTFGFSSDVFINLTRVELFRDDVARWLSHLPDEFKEGHSGYTVGCSIQESFFDRDGNIWTTDICVAEKLFMMGQALGLVGCAPRGTWESGFPAYWIREQAIPKDRRALIVNLAKKHQPEAARNRVRFAQPA